MRYEIIENGTVTNAIIATPDFMQANFAPGTYRVADVPSIAISEPRHITVGALFDRFGPAKWAILADTNPAVQAVIKDASVRSYIDLENPDLPAGLAIVQGAGHSIDANAVLTAPIQPKERP